MNNKNKDNKNIENIDKKTLIAAFCALNGTEILKRLSKYGLEFIYNTKVEYIENGIILCQDYSVEIANNVNAEQLIFASNIYFNNQFNLINEFGGIISQIMGNSFLSYWEESKKEDIITMVTKLKKRKEEVNNIFKEKCSYIKIKNIYTYIDEGNFILGKNGSFGRFNFCAMGEFVNRMFNIMNGIYKNNLDNHVFFGEKYITGINYNFKYLNTLKLNNKLFKIYTI